MTSLPWDDRKSKSVARMKRANGIWRFQRTVHGISYINGMFIVYFLYKESMFFFIFVLFCYRLNNGLHV
ncbi:hypothetical protein Hanom_Chr17g01579111 [Helianthus anomalus]